MNGEDFKRREDFERLIRIEDAVQALSSQVLSHRQADEEFHNDLKKILFGNGKVGLTTKVDRLEQAHGRTTWFMGAVAVMLLGVAGRLLAEWLIKR